jgi:hypothetical protein
VSQLLRYPTVPFNAALQILGVIIRQKTQTVIKHIESSHSVAGCIRQIELFSSPLSKLCNRQSASKLPFLISQYRDYQASPFVHSISNNCHIKPWGIHGNLELDVPPGTCLTDTLISPQSMFGSYPFIRNVVQDSLDITSCLCPTK